MTWQKGKPHITETSTNILVVNQSQNEVMCLHSEVLTGKSMN